MTTRRYPSGIVGLRFPNRDGVPGYQVAGLMAVGDVVELRPDPANPHDPAAIAVYATLEGFRTIETALHHVGYVPARHTGWIGEQLASGRAITATVGEIHRDPRGQVVNVDLDIDLERGPGSGRKTQDATPA